MSKSLKLFVVGTLLALGCQQGMSNAGEGMPPRVVGLRTTDGRVAMANLQAQIDGLTRRGTTTVESAAALAGLIGMRGRCTGSIADYEHVAAIAAATATQFPDNARSHLLQAQALALFHRFDAALAELDIARQLGAKTRELDTARAGILQGMGRYDEALVIGRQQASGNPSTDTLGALATLQGERGEWEEAQRLYAEALSLYRDVSPFPVAWLLFEEGSMWTREGSLERARAAFQAAWSRLPDYAPAQGHLGEVELALGNFNRAVDVLRPLADRTDPDYAAQLARALTAAGKSDEATEWRQLAAQRFEVLIDSHPEAFADHAAEFWLSAGGDQQKALRLAQSNLAVRQTPRAYELALEAALAAGDGRVACDTANRAQASGASSPALAELVGLASAGCKDRTSDS